ncbi:hypothetical protein J6590_107574, partial [Homalodisca vitripennis]
IMNWWSQKIMWRSTVWCSTSPLLRSQCRLKTITSTFTIPPQLVVAVSDCFE